MICDWPNKCTKKRSKNVIFQLLIDLRLFFKSNNMKCSLTSLNSSYRSGQDILCTGLRMDNKDILLNDHLNHYPGLQPQGGSTRTAKEYLIGSPPPLNLRSLFYCLTPFIHSRL